MVYNIVKQHQGFVDVYSQKGVGSTFNIYLPVLKSISEKREEPSAKEIQKGEGCILVIDDEEIVRQTAKAILEECGYQVLVADNGIKGIAIYKKKRDIIDGVLLDLVMPKLSGKQTYLKLKKIDQNVKVLLSSGFKKDSRIESILQAGVDGFINKPYSLTSLSKAIYNVLNR
jgi:CheY-like chemotaxis protein